MQELIAQLVRLYGVPATEELQRQIDGTATRAFDLVSDGAVCAIVIPFDGDGAAQWERLCEVARVLQAELGLPAPAVSISGATGYRLWLSFEDAVPVPLAQQFLDALGAAHFRDAALPADGVQAPVELPPCVNRSTGKWAAFIHPGMGASFADEPALEMAPPLAGQVQFLQGLDSISSEQLRHALAVLRPAPTAAPAPQPVAQPGLLLKDATLEDIVRHLHAMNIEPTFRHLIGR